MQKYKKLIDKLQKVREVKVTHLQDELARLQKDCKDAKQGYMKTVLNKRIAENTQRLANLVETAQLQQLQLQCEYECEKVEASILQDSGSSDDYSDGNNPLNMENEEDIEDSSEFDSDDDSPEALKWRRRRELRQQMRELKEKYQLGSRNVDNAMKNLNVTSPEADVDDGDDGSILTAHLMIAHHKQSHNLLTTSAVALQNVNKAVEGAVVNHVLVPASKAITSTYHKMSRRLNRKITHAVDVASIRTKKIFAKMYGTFDEIQKEMKFEIFHQYVQHQVSIAKQKAIDEFAVIETGGYLIHLIIYQMYDYFSFSRTSSR